MTPGRGPAGPPAAWWVGQIGQIGRIRQIRQTIAETPHHASHPPRHQRRRHPGPRDLRLDAVIAEATFGLQTSGVPDLASAHMNYPLLCELRDALLCEGVIAPATPFVATHLSLHFCPPYEESAAWLAQRGVQAGYDGMRVEW